MPVIPYLAQVSLYWLLLYACYWLLLRRHTFFAWNRAYLLASLLGAFALPLVEYPEAAPPVVYEVPAWAASEVAVEPMAGFSPPARMEAGAEQVPDTPWLTWPLALSVVYLAGLLAMGVRLGRHYRRLMRFLGRLEGLDMERYRLYVLPDDAIGSFSFLHHIVLNRTDYEHNLDTILSHELVHVRQRHSWDILLVEALRVLFWFNPVLMLYKRSLQQVHEYLADREVCACDAPRDGYAEFMLAYALRGPAEPLVNSFFKSSLLKDRIMMLYKTKNSNWSLGRYALVAGFTLLIAGLISGFQPRTDPQKEPLPELIVQVEGIVVDTDGKPLQGVKVLIKDEEDTNRRLVQAITDADGAYVVDVPVGRELIFDLTGYKPVSIEIKGYMVVNATLAGAKSDIPSTTEVLPSLESKKAEQKWDGFGKLIPRFYEDIAPKKRQEPEEFKIYFLGSEDTGPAFPGGPEALRKFISARVAYPARAVIANVQGKVLLTFEVSSTGAIGNVSIIKDPGFDLGKESLRLVTAMPDWIPARENGKPVDANYSLTFDFKLSTLTEKPNRMEVKTVPTGEQFAHIQITYHRVPIPRKQSLEVNLAIMDKVGAENALVMINGMPAKNMDFMKELSVNELKSVWVLDSAAARRLYGPLLDGRENVSSVVQVFTKK